MPDVEHGNPILIGTTTFNPFFALVPALLSRSLVCELKPLAAEDILILLRRALADRERGVGHVRVQVEAEALEHLAQVCDGDARRALTALEVAVAWGYVTGSEAADASDKLDHVVAMLFKLTRRR